MGHIDRSTVSLLLIYDVINFKRGNPYLVVLLPSLHYQLLKMIYLERLEHLSHLEHLAIKKILPSNSSTFRFNQELLEV